jgi:hypothetical protein|tara:strand:- start:72 stop:335 length:264 start_codon:yes stop_codon:yes gene_type:complete
MKIPEKVNGVPLKKNVIGFMKDLEKFQQIQEKYLEKIQEVEIKYSGRMYKLQDKLRVRRDKFTGTCEGQVQRLTNSESISELINLDI